MGPQAPDVSLLIVSWNTRDLLSRCLDSIERHLMGSTTAYDVIVVDNASTDGSVEMLRSRARSESALRLICNRANVGFARATNQAFEASRGEFVALVNSDIQLLDDAVSPLIEHLRRRWYVGAVSCELVGTDGRPQAIHRRFPTLPILFFSATRIGSWIDHRLLGLQFHRRRLSRNYQEEAFSSVDQAAAAFLVLRRTTVSSIQYLLDESFPLLGNDVDLCRRLWNAGLEVHVRHDVRVLHEGSASLKQLSGDNLRALKSNWLHRYYATHEPTWKHLLLNLMVPVSRPQHKESRDDGSGRG